MSQARTTDDVLQHHLEAVGDSDYAAMLADYGEDSVLFTPDGPIRGLDNLEAFFRKFLGSLPPTFMADFTMLRQDVDGEVAYIVWHSGDFAPLGTDTFVVRDGKIIAQTFAMYQPGAAGG